MPRCPACGQSFQGERDQVGARCPLCREPLYEEPRDPRRAGGQAAAQGTCALHPGNAAGSTCQRCGNFLCPVCWTRWSGQTICPACLERALESSETSPLEARAHLRQALLAIIFGVLAWGITLLSILIMVVGFANQRVEVAGIGVLIMLGSPLPAVLGVGQGAAAIRARGNHMIVATLGLVLSGVHIGMIVGLFTFSLLEN
ncbi:MAG: hypothetical protein JNM56_29935 [Planctomycetia bacterium]|nr:hypothetical protein [Planctomycetia bacterium]